MIFKTNRLMVREFMVSDLDAFYIMQSDPKVMQFIKPTLSYEETKTELSIIISYYSDPRKFYNLWAIIDSANKQLIGLCGVYENKQSEYEIAYRFIPVAWGQGYGNEIAKSLIKYCFSELKLELLVGFAETQNIGSCKILENHMDFVEEKTYKPNGLMGRKYSLKKPLYN